MYWIGRSKCAVVLARATCALTLPLLAACSSSDDGSPGPNPASPTAPVSKNLVFEGVVPVAGRPEEHTNVGIFGTGFQSGATVTFNGIASAATVEGGWIITSAPPHPAGPVPVVVTNPDGRSQRMENAFTYVE